MSINFTVSISKNFEAQLKRDIQKRMGQNAGLFLKTILFNMHRKVPAIRKFIDFMSSDQFRSDFGIEKAEADKMQADFRKVFEGSDPFQHSELRKEGNDVVVRLVDQEFLRRLTFFIWDTASTSKKRYTFVNAWDVYEYGVVAFHKKDIIKGFELIEAKSRQQKIISRSDLSLMKKTRGKFFRFHHGKAPRINAIRAGLLKRADSIADASGAILKRILK